MEQYDVIVIGAGASGLTSAMYSARAGLNTIIVEKGVYGGQITKTADVENYSGFGLISGADLSEHMYQQAISQGVKYMYGDVKSITQTENGLHQVNLKSKSLTAKAVIIATGVEHRHLGVEGEERLSGRGVSYCAICDGNFFVGKNVVVVGGGDSALEEANYLSNIVDKVTIVHRRDKFRGQKVLQDRVFNNPKIDIIFNHNVTNIIGEDKVKMVGLEHSWNGNGIVSGMLLTNVDGVFIYVGLDPITKPFESLGILDEKGYIITDERMATSVGGIFAVGDVRQKMVRQIATAVGDGAIAGTQVRSYIDSLD